MPVFGAERERRLAGIQSPGKRALHRARSHFLGKVEVLDVLAGGVDVSNHGRGLDPSAERVQRDAAIGRGYQGRSAGDAADWQTRFADICACDHDGVQRVVVVRGKGIVYGMEGYPVCAGLIISVPAPILAERAIQGENAAIELPSTWAKTAPTELRSAYQLLALGSILPRLVVPKVNEVILSVAIMDATDAGINGLPLSIDKPPSFRTSEASDWAKL